MTEITSIMKDHTDPYFHRERDAKAVCHALSCIRFGVRSPKDLRIKLSKEEFKRWLEICSFINQGNYIIYMNMLLDKCLKEGLSMDEIRGEFQQETVSMYNLLSKHPMGKTCFNSISIEDLMCFTDPADLIRSSAK
jgi:hypothetical protein